jgi:hypothetical protein
MSIASRGACAALLVGIAACAGEIRLTSGDAGAGGIDEDAGAGATTTGCTSDDGCSSVGGHCDTVAHQCVACLVDAHCQASGLRRCDVALHRCVDCGVANDCADGQTCEPTTRHCVASCTDGGSCPDNSKCNTDRGICVACTTTSECDSDKTCDVASGRCIECTTDASCRGDRRRCDTVSGRCAECLVATDCRQDGNHEAVCDLARLECSN